ncbi:MAG TPA: GDP-mannose 4,6-dehydratase, partial [Candidatus Magasanikbacteria bacterium]|nr:GDP-mannose 4,6-dehydratase [Candidatus Magasanikbacteria bacterium]
ETYCVGGDGERTNLEITQKILELLNLGDDMVEYVVDRPGHDRRYAINFSKIKNELGWTPKTSFEEGMKKTVAWYKENEDWWKKIKTGQYLDYYNKQYKK